MPWTMYTYTWWFEKNTPNYAAASPKSTKPLGINRAPVFLERNPLRLWLEDVFRHSQSSSVTRHLNRHPTKTKSMKGKFAKYLGTPYPLADTGYLASKISSVAHAGLPLLEASSFVFGRFQAAQNPMSRRTSITADHTFLHNGEYRRR